ncbi:MAG: GGDEF domain-containing protein, partial [Gemmatimonadetes bacterium]|nr:GGDEF domain-containing protein [Gemmatimonadota bacterium]
MSGALLSLVFGVVAGGVIGWRLARWAMPRPGHVPQPLADDRLGEDPAAHIPAIPLEATFESLGYALVERCALRVGLPCALIVRDGEGAPAAIAAIAGGLDARLVGFPVPLDTPAGRAITDGIPVVGQESEPVVRASRGDRRRAVHGGVAVPVGVASRVVGAVVAFGEPREGAGETVRALEDLVARFAPRLVPAHAVAVAEKKAVTDELTGLPNRRALNAAVARIGSERAALVVLDVDHFKQINDTLGHPAGDAALQHVARLLREAVRGRDIPARVGGEEFAVWLPSADLKLGREVAERLRQQVEASPFRHNGH